MRRELLELIQCPACAGGALEVVEGEEDSLRYGDHELRELRQGVVVCQRCSARFPVEGYVLSFAALLDPSVRADGAYWGQYYGHLYRHGFTGFMDTRVAPTPFVGTGIRQALPFGGEEWGGPHVQLAEHPFVRPGGRVVDVGVGTGWSSLFLARRGFEVIAFDPALELMQMAKAYAIAQGVYLEYLCSDMASLHLPPASVDAVFALHSLHHVPDVDAALARIHTILKVGGALAIDEHLQDSVTLAQLRDGLLQEAEANIFPSLRDPALIADLPAPHSENEGVGMGGMLEAIENYLHVDTIEYRHIGLDFAGPLYFLQQGCDPQALNAASEVVALVNRAMRRVWPDMAEYVTLVAQKQEQPPAGPVYSPGPRDRFIDTHAQLARQQQEIDRLHTLIAEKNNHIHNLERLIERIGNGRVMRLLRWASGKG